MILVTGGFGFIGSAIVRALRARGDKVLEFDNGYRGKGKAFKGVADVRDRHAVDFVVQQCDEIIHCAYINGTPIFYEKPDLVLDVAVKGISNLIDACRVHSIKKFTLLSSSEVCRADLNPYRVVRPPTSANLTMTVDGWKADEKIPLVIPDPYNPRYSYSAGKIISEMMCLHSGNIFDRLLIVRPFNVYGPNMSTGHVVPDFYQQLVAKLPMPDPIPFDIFGNGDETRSFCFIDDFIRGFMLVRDKGEHRGIYNIGTDDENTIRSLANMMADIAGRRITIREANKFREGDVPRRKPDISKLRALGYEPQVDLYNGLKITMQESICASSKNAKFADQLT